MAIAYKFDGNGISSFKDSKANLGLDMIELRFRMKGFRFGDVRVLFDAKHPCFEPIRSFKVFLGKSKFCMNVRFF